MRETLVQILLMISISFFSAFAIGLNKYVAMTISNEEDKPASKLLILSEVLIYGLSGFFIGLIATQYTDNIYMLIAISGSGGMVGQKLLFVVLKSTILGIMDLSDKEEKDDD